MSNDYCELHDICGGCVLCDIDEDVERIVGEKDVQIADLQQQLKQREWISCAERLPEHQETVLININGVVGLASYNQVLGFPTLYFGSQVSYGHNPAHWMPLPTADKEK